MDSIISKIKEFGYTYAINFPYKGSIIPNIVYKGHVKGKVISIMLEINKNVYLVWKNSAEKFILSIFFKKKVIVC